MFEKKKKHHLFIYETRPQAASNSARAKDRAAPDLRPGLESGVRGGRRLLVSHFHLNLLLQTLHRRKVGCPSLLPGVCGPVNISSIGFYVVNSDGELSALCTSGIN